MIKRVIICVLLVMILFNMAFSLNVFASDIDLIIEGMEETKTGDLSDTRINQGLNKIFSIIRYVGSGLSIIVVMMLAIKYMVASVADKAEIKKQAIPVVIGCFLIFATLNIVSLVMEIINGI